MQSLMTVAMSRNIKNQISLQKMEVSKEYKSDYCHIRLGDCVKLVKDIPDESIGFSIFSPPLRGVIHLQRQIRGYGQQQGL